MVKIRKKFLLLNQNTRQLAARMNGSQKNLPKGILRSLLRSSSLLFLLALLLTPLSASAREEESRGGDSPSEVRRQETEIRGPEDESRGREAEIRGQEDEIRQEDRQEDRREDRQEDRREDKREDRQEDRQENRQEGRQESRQESRQGNGLGNSGSNFQGPNWVTPRPTINNNVQSFSREDNSSRMGSESGNNLTAGVEIEETNFEVAGEITAVFGDAFLVDGKTIIIDTSKISNLRQGTELIVGKKIKVEGEIIEGAKYAQIISSFEDFGETEAKIVEPGVEKEEDGESFEPVEQIRGVLRQFLQSLR